MEAVREVGPPKRHAAKPKVLALSIHRAPYRDPVFQLVHRRGFVEIEVATMFEEDGGHPFWELGNPEYPNTYLGANWMFSGQHALHPRIIDLLRRGNFDVVIIPGTNHFTSLAAILYCLKSNLPYILNFDTIRPDERRRFLFDQFKRMALQRASGFWVPGTASREYFKTLVIPSDRIFEGAYTLDEPTIRAELRQAEDLRDSILGKFGIRKDGVTLLMVANLLPTREHVFLLRVFAEVLKTHPRANLVMVGDGPEKARLEQTIRSSGLEVAYLIAGVPFNELAELYSVSDIYVHTGAEPYSTAVSFAAIAGIPIVTSRMIGASWDFVFHGSTGYLVDNTVESWTSALTNLIVHPETRERMSKELALLSQVRGLVWAAEQLEAAVCAAMVETTPAMQ